MFEVLWLVSRPDISVQRYFDGFFSPLNTKTICLLEGMSVQNSFIYSVWFCFPKLL